MSSLGNGGAERSLVNLLNELPYDKYETDLLLFKKSGMFLKQVPSQVHILHRPKILKRLYGPIEKSGVWFLFKIFTTIISLIFEKDKSKGYQTRFQMEIFL